MRRPKQLKILGRDFTVRTVKGLTYGNHKVDGLACTDSAEITIDEAADYESTLLHEVIHCVIRVGGFDKWMSVRREESLVLALEQELHRLYRRR